MVHTKLTTGEYIVTEEEWVRCSQFRCCLWKWVELAGGWEVIAAGPGSLASLGEGVCVCVCVTTSVCYDVSVAM